MNDYEIYTPTAEEVHSGVLGRRMRQFNYGFVGEYGQTQPVWVSARDTKGELLGGLRGFVFLQWLNVELLFCLSTNRPGTKGWAEACWLQRNRKPASWVRTARR
jgi:hypothetical protein